MSILRHEAFLSIKARRVGASMEVSRAHGRDMIFCDEHSLLASNCKSTASDAISPSHNLGPRIGAK
jgi:hypothetical protein